MEKGTYWTEDAVQCMRFKMGKKGEETSLCVRANATTTARWTGTSRASDTTERQRHVNALYSLRYHLIRYLILAYSLISGPSSIISWLSRCGLFLCIFILLTNQTIILALGGLCGYQIPSVVSICTGLRFDHEFSLKRHGLLSSFSLFEWFSTPVGCIYIFWENQSHYFYIFIRYLGSAFFLLYFLYIFAIHYSLSKAFPRTMSLTVYIRNTRCTSGGSFVKNKIGLFLYIYYS